MFKRSNKKSKSKGFTQEEELLLNDFSRTVSKSSTILFYISGFIMSVIPTWILVNLHWVDPFSYTLLLFLTPLTIYSLKVAYYNLSQKIKYRIVMKREGIPLKKLPKRTSEEWKNKKLDRNDKNKLKIYDTDYEATFASIFFNNAIFLGVTLFLNLIVLKSLTPEVGLCLSTAGTAGVLALLSTTG